MRNNDRYRETVRYKARYSLYSAGRVKNVGHLLMLMRQPQHTLLMPPSFESYHRLEAEVKSDLTPLLR